MRQSHLSLPTADDSTTLAVLVARDGVIHDADQRFAALTGLHPSSLASALHEADRPETVLALERPQSSVNCRIRLADATWRHVELRRVDLPDEQITLVIDRQTEHETVIDLTQNLALQDVQATLKTDTLRAIVSSLVERNADLDSFAHAAAHDLKAPLRTIKVFSELANAEIDASHPARPYLDRVESGAARMADLVDSLLQLAAAGRDAVMVRRCELTPVLDQVRSDLDFEIEQCGATIDLDTDAAVMADPVALAVILRNLIGNAIKYRSELQPRVEISAAATGDTVTIKVSDNGIGVEPARAEEIFEPFRRLHPLGTYDGSGVGLAICRRLTTRLDGVIWATAHTGPGMTVSIELPSP